MLTNQLAALYIQNVQKNYVQHKHLEMAVSSVVNIIKSFQKCCYRSSSLTEMIYLKKYESCIQRMK